MKPINVGIIGLGVVGGGTAQVLRENASEISRRLGRDVRVTMVSRRDTTKAQEIIGTDTDITITADAATVVNQPDIDIIVELIGGTTIAKDMVLQAIANGKHVVTANKKLLAEHGNEIFAAAKAKNVMVMFEAAVAGGIPIIKSLREGLAANKIEWIAGIINGTSNFILSEMRAKGSDFADVLKEAQEKGYAEADPTFDIEGHDAGHKLTIMSSVAFGVPLDFSKCYLEGISTLEGKDIKYAEELGYRVKLLGITRRREDGVELRVHPTLIPEERLIAKVDGVMNAVLVKADMVGVTMHYGPGAGSLPTASSVVADILDICRLMDSQAEQRVPYLAFQPDQVQTLPAISIDDIRSSYYLRITSTDEPGVLAAITSMLAQHNISVEALIQKATDHQEAEIVILTHSALERDVKEAIERIENLQRVVTPVVMIRMEPFSG
ncbi:homoserine dehydrogenase [Vitreoscilla stercoraria]|uniref:Homoserine dehydrogenase n=1 Tax=Vitreoscilla stercoraria TaxID=61 RepID=A0ABY4EEP4_VITST|nr:homoserine dehydrogenase [Vitreoscilla stercoraria]UOO93168.1 homoserine dehydrogenase [Vitreoscilla stercoraria]